MSRSPKCPRLSLEQDFQDPNEAQESVVAQVPTAEEEDHGEVEKEKEDEEKEVKEEKENLVEEKEVKEEKENLVEEKEVKEEKENLVEEKEVKEEKENLVEEKEVKEEKENLVEEKEVKEEKENLVEEKEEKEEKENLVEEKEVKEEKENLVEEKEEEEKKEAEEEEAKNDEKSISFTSLNISPTSVSPHPSSSPLTQVDAEEERPPEGILCVPQSSQSSFSSISLSTLHEESRHQEEDDSNTLQTTTGTESLKKLQNKKITELVNVLLLKYRKKEPITQMEMLKVVTKAWEKQFPIIFKGACKCLEAIFGIEIKESRLICSSYILVNSLNLTYEDIMTYDKGKPRNGFLILILGVIFIDGNSSSEESIWEFLNGMGIYDGKEHFIYGEPRKFLTRDLVQENYLEYQQVPNSHPPSFKFLWGPRAYAETTKVKVLEFLSKFICKNPMRFSFLYAEAFKDDEERAWARAHLLSSANALLMADRLLEASEKQSEELVCSAVESSDDSQ